MRTATSKLVLATAVAFAGTSASAAVFQDKNGNVGYSTMKECNQAIANGTAKFYKSHTSHAPKRRRGERSVRKMKLSQVSAKYANGACDRGVGRKGGRDGVARALQGKYVPYSPDMLVNVYMDRRGNPVRISMAKCDNWFSANFPSPFVKPYQATRAKPVYVPPKPVYVPPAPAAPSAAALKAAAAAKAAAASAGTAGGIGILPVLGAVAAVGVAAAVIANNDDKKTGGTGTTGTN